MLHCPDCRATLRRTPVEEGLVWTCRQCGGHAATIQILRKNLDGSFVNRLWSRIAAGEVLGSRPDRPCPSCDRAMREITEDSLTGPVEIEVCPGCQVFWFDTSERERLPMRPADAPPPELDPRVREALALVEIEVIRRRHQGSEFDEEPPDAWWQLIVAMLGLPSESDDEGLVRWPLATWGLALLLLAFWWLTAPKLEDWVSAFGLIPAAPLRHHGVTFLTSFFLHGGWFHLLSNLYFLLVFGDNVEDLIGRFRYLLLILAGTIAGGLSHLALDPESTVPVIGASGGLSALVVFYALALPRNKIGLFLFYRWIRLSARWALVLWLGAQAIGVFHQVIGISRVSALAHLGGAAVGVVAWVLWKFPPVRLRGDRED